MGLMHTHPTTRTKGGSSTAALPVRLSIATAKPANFSGEEMFNHASTKHSRE